MLTNSVVIGRLSEVIGENKLDFKIDLLLFLLKYTGRIIGYPNYKGGDNSKYPVTKIRQRIDNAKRIKNPHEFNSMMDAIKRLLICFAYFKDSLAEKAKAPDVQAALLKAIGARDDITDEEKCAERSLLLAMIKHDKDILILLDEYWSRLQPASILEMARQEFTLSGQRYLKNIATLVPDDQELFISREELRQATKLVTDKIEGVNLLKPYLTSKIKLQRILAKVVLDEHANERQDDWVIKSNVLNKSCLMVEREIGVVEDAKNKVRQYIEQRQSEWEICTCFKKYPKALKLSAAEKYLGALSNQRPLMFFSPKEQAALEADPGSRLTSLFQEQQLFSFKKRS